jgi:hypothetical protein
MIDARFLPEARKVVTLRGPHSLRLQVTPDATPGSVEADQNLLAAALVAIDACGFTHEDMDLHNGGWFVWQLRTNQTASPHMRVVCKLDVRAATNTGNLGLKVADPAILVCAEGMDEWTVFRGDVLIRRFARRLMDVLLVVGARATEVLSEDVRDDTGHCTLRRWTQQLGQACYTVELHDDGKTPSLVSFTGDGWFWLKREFLLKATQLIGQPDTLLLPGFVS